MMTNPHPSEEEINLEQMKRLLQYIERSQSEPVIASLFSQLGHECFRVRQLDAWIEAYHGDVTAFLDWVNVQQGSRYWERLEFSADGRALLLTGRKVQECACRLADRSSPPRSLCHYCCREFQREIFEKLLGQAVAVEITEAFLLGDERCSTRIQLLGDRAISAGAGE